MNPSPNIKQYTPAAVSSNGIAAALTGAGPFSTFVLSGAGDLLGHLISLTSAANLSAINFTIAGTDANDNAITETIAGPNINTVTSTHFFKTVTKITASSTLGANTMDVGWAAKCATPLKVVNYKQSNFNVSQAITLDGGSAINFDVQYGYDTTPTETSKGIFTAQSAKTANQDTHFVSPIAWVRSVINSNTSAVFTEYVHQGEAS